MVKIILKDDKSFQRAFTEVAKIDGKIFDLKEKQKKMRDKINLAKNKFKKNKKPIKIIL